MTRPGAALAAATVLVLLPAAPALASCAQQQSAALREHPDVVVGTALEQRGPRALLAVEEVWAGAARPPRLWVRTRDGSSTGVALTPGRRYAVGLRGDRPRTDVCLVLADEGALRALRPADLRLPVVGADPGDEPRDRVPATGAALALGSGVLLIGWWRVRRLRSRPAASAAGRPRRRGPAPG